MAKNEMVSRTLTGSNDPEIDPYAKEKPKAKASELKETPRRTVDKAKEKAYLNKRQEAIDKAKKSPPKVKQLASKKSKGVYGD